MSGMLSSIKRFEREILVVAAIICIFAFVVIDPLTMYMRRGSDQQMPQGAVVRINGASFTESQLGRVRAANVAASELAMELARAAFQEKKEPRVDWRGYAPNERQLVWQFVFADKARNLGINVTQDEVMSYLVSLSADTRTRLDIEGMVKELQGVRSGYVTDRMVYEAVRRYLARDQLDSFLRSGIRPVEYPSQIVPPALAWDCYQRIHRKIRVEVLPISVESFLPKVTESPTTQEIETLYNSFKEMPPIPASPNPGFASPQRIAFEHVRIDRKAIQDAEMDKITNEAIEKEYNERVSRGDPLVRERPAPPKSRSNSGTQDQSSDDDSQKSDENQGSAPGVPNETPAEKSQDPEKSQENETAVDPGASENSDSGASPSQSEDSDESSDSRPGNPLRNKKKEGASRVHKNDFYLVSQVLPDSNAPEEKSTPVGNANAGESKESSDEAPADSNTDSSAKSKGEDKDTSNEKSSTDANASQQEPGDETGFRYKPLDDDMRKTLRQNLAQKPVQETLKKIVEEVESAVNEFGRKIRKYNRRKESAKPSDKNDEVRPEFTAMNELREKYQLTYGTMDLSDRFEAEKSGQDIVSAQKFIIQRNDFQMVSFVDFAYGASYDIYEPQQIDQIDDIYVFWKTEEQKQQTEPLEKVRDQVVHAWKLKKALELAKAEAAALLKKVDQSKTLTDNFPDKAEEIRQTDEPFSWITPGPSMPSGVGNLRISQVKEIEFAGNDFMRAAYALEPGGVTFGVDQPQKVVYLIRHMEEQPSRLELKSRFVNAGWTQDVQGLAYSELVDSINVWQEQSAKDANEFWTRPARVFDRGQDGGDE